MYRVGIVGSRRRDTAKDLDAVRKAFVPYEGECIRIISGGCPKGGDRFAEVIAAERDIPIMIHRANWKIYGRGAGFIRNTDIAKESDVLIACVAEDRKGGTEDTIKKFKKFHPKGLVILV